MLRILSHVVLTVAAVCGCWLSAPQTTQAADRGGRFHDADSCPECRQRQLGQPDLFYNYYVPPNCGGVGAQMYLAPRPVPAYVGHTYYTYQPFMPHEMLYPHQRVYHRYYDEGRGLTRVHATWYNPPGSGVAGFARHMLHFR